MSSKLFRLTFAISLEKHYDAAMQIIADNYMNKIQFALP